MLPRRLREFSLIPTSVILSRGRTPERRTQALPHAPTPSQGIFTDPYECHPESRANARAKDPDAPSCSHAASGNSHQHVRTSVKLETRSSKLSFLTSKCKTKVLSIPFATVVGSNLLNLSQINIAQFGGFTPRTMSFYKYGRKKFFLPITEWLSVLSARDDHGPSPETGISFWCHSSSCHSSDLKDRSRSEQSSNRDFSQYCYHSEQLQLRGICCWVFAEWLDQANRRSHPCSCICSCLCGADALVREKQRASRSLPEAHRI